MREQMGKLLDAITDFDLAFTKYGMIIESPAWQTEGQKAWRELVVAMNRLRDAQDEAQF